MWPDQIIQQEAWGFSSTEAQWNSALHWSVNWTVSKVGVVISVFSQGVRMAFFTLIEPSLEELCWDFTMLQWKYVINMLLSNSVLKHECAFYICVAVLTPDFGTISIYIYKGCKVELIRVEKSMQESGIQLHRQNHRFKPHSVWNSSKMDTAVKHQSWANFK